MFPIKNPESDLKSSSRNIPCYQKYFNAQYLNINIYYLKTTMNSNPQFFNNFFKK